eukprot:TRINITY_DN16334_c0_g1_i1.p1 TRINITY_DN16334_c0_g1~~TRINITY_DN16334_c0_g1_i1.p1  ORF type:complete len:734 (+),score=291.36 TRINITY_DN16334_c0_g1_i1:257-2203(+)
MRPIDDAAVATLIPADLEQMLLTVGTADLTLTGTNGKLRPFVAVVPDTLRHGAALYGNDDLSGGAGNDVVVGDAAFHHAMLNLEVKALEEVREHAAARWGEIQFRLARLSVDAGTYEAEGGRLAVPAQLHSGNDRLAGGDGNDTLVGDRLEAFTDVVSHHHFAHDLEETANGLILTYHDFEILAVDVAHALYESHHAVVQQLYESRHNAQLAPEPQLYLSNDIIDGDSGNDLVAGDSLLLVLKGFFLNETHRSDAQIGWHRHHKHHHHHRHGNHKKTSNDLYKDLEDELEDHIRYTFNPSPDVSSGDLKDRDDWNTLPYTKWGCDVVHGGSGHDSLVGDYGLVVVATFDGALFDPSTHDGLDHIDDALDDHLKHVDHELEERLTKPKEKHHAVSLDDKSFDNHLKDLVMYHKKGKHTDDHDEPPSSSQSDKLFGDTGSDLMSDSNGVAVLPMWRPTNSVVRSSEVKVSRSFFKVLDADHWKRLDEYEKRDKTFDRDVLSGGSTPGERDVFYTEHHDKDDTLTDEERHVDEDTSDTEDIAGILAETYAGTAHATCLNELALDGVPDGSVHAFSAMPVYGWDGLFGVVWANYGVVQSHIDFAHQHYLLHHPHHRYFYEHYFHHYHNHYHYRHYHRRFYRHYYRHYRHHDD